MFSDPSSFGSVTALGLPGLPLRLGLPGLPVLMGGLAFLRAKESTLASFLGLLGLLGTSFFILVRIHLPLPSFLGLLSDPAAALALELLGLLGLVLRSDLEIPGLLRLLGLPGLLGFLLEEREDAAVKTTGLLPCLRG